jgi:hypothetical protein
MPPAASATATCQGAPRYLDALRAHREQMVENIRRMQKGLESLDATIRREEQRLELHRRVGESS